MFIVCFGDGLGNQMFQYAFYIALQEKYPENDVYMDIFNIYGKKIHNGFELNKIFGIEIKETQLSKVLQLADYWPDTKIKYKIMNKIHNIRRYIFGIKESHITQDDPTGYYDNVFRLNNVKSYLFRGNWVNEKYFESVRDILLADFKFPLITEEHNLWYLEKISNCESVSVHIRKGDYVNSAMLNMPVNYYKRAKIELEKRVYNPHYFIFTDDKAEVEEYIGVFDKYTIIEGNDKENSYRDMQLMSLCKHNIIANSTFSFWGAYLNLNRDKVVIAPNKAKYDFKNPFASKDWIIIPYDDTVRTVEI